MAKMFITLPNGRKVGLGVYAKAWRELLKANPRESIKGFGYFSETAESVLHAMRGGLSERINAKIPGYGVGRKWSNEWFIETWRAARDLNTPRLAIHWLPVWLKPRFGDRLAG